MTRDEHEVQRKLMAHVGAALLGAEISDDEPPPGSALAVLKRLSRMRDAGELTTEEVRYYFRLIFPTPEHQERGLR